MWSYRLDHLGKHHLLKSQNKTKIDNIYCGKTSSRYVLNEIKLPSSGKSFGEHC